MTAPKLTIEERLDRIERMIIIATKEVLSVAEVALLLGKSESRIRHMTSEGLLPYYKDGSRTLFRKSEVESTLLKHRVATAQEVAEEAATYIATSRI